jgi:hypothetical protein
MALRVSGGGAPGAPVTVESAHPFAAAADGGPADLTARIELPGASAMRVTWDERCSCTQGHDRIDFFADAACEQRMPGTSADGYSNRPSYYHPTDWNSCVVIAGASAYVRFHVHGAPSEDDAWGFRLTAAPLALPHEEWALASAAAGGRRLTLRVMLLPSPLSGCPPVAVMALADPVSGAELSRYAGRAVLTGETEDVEDGFSDWPRVIGTRPVERALGAADVAPGARLTLSLASPVAEKEGEVFEVLSGPVAVAAPQF